MMFQRWPRRAEQHWVDFAVIGALIALAGAIMIYVGASRALHVIDALPAALNLLLSEVQQQQAVQPQPKQNIQQEQPVQYEQPVQAQTPPPSPYVPPQTPQHLICNESRSEEQRPVQ
jgi:outer membrane biosynthesis protein TonB